MRELRVTLETVTPMFLGEVEVQAPKSGREL
jgi:hypothetical protein